MKLQSPKNRSNFMCEKGTFLQIGSHIRMHALIFTAGKLGFRAFIYNIQISKKIKLILQQNNYMILMCIRVSIYVLKRYVNVNQIMH